MAEIKVTGVEPFGWFYNVSRSVGRGGSNEREDTRLVQYLLKKVFDSAGSVDEWASAKPKQELVIDGFCGPITCRYLLAYQKLRVVTLRDCLVDHAVGSGLAVGMHIYTIYALNTDLQLGYPEIFTNPALATDMPPELKAVMMRIAAQAPVAALAQ